MRSYRWIFITVGTVVGLLIVAIAVGGIWLNSFIHSPAFLSEVQQRAGQSLGGPVQIKSIDFDIFHGVKLTGFVTQIDLSRSGGKGTLSASVASVNCTYSWPELFQRELKLTGLTLEQPQLTLAEGPVAPMPSQNAAASGDTSGSPSGPVSGGTSSSAFQFVLDRLQVNNATFDLLNSNGENAVELKGLYASANTADYVANQNVSGSINIATASIAPAIVVTNFSTPYTYHAGAVTASALSGSVFGGSLAGDYNMAGFGAGPSILNLNGKGLDVSKLLIALSPTSSSAMLTGTLAVQSKWRSVELGAVDGEGDLQLTGGQLHGVQILDQIGGILRINELKDPVISQGQTHFQMANQQTTLTSLQLVCSGFNITGGGTVAFNGGLNLNLVLVLSSDAMGRLPQPVASSFVKQADGTGTIGFNVTGTTSNPQTDLPQRLLLQNTQIKNVINKALNNFFH